MTLDIVKMVIMDMMVEICDSPVMVVVFVVVVVAVMNRRINCRKDVPFLMCQ